MIVARCERWALALCALLGEALFSTFASIFGELEWHALP